MERTFEEELSFVSYPFIDMFYFSIVLYTTSLETRLSDFAESLV